MRMRPESKEKKTMSEIALRTRAGRGISTMRRVLSLPILRQTKRVIGYTIWTDGFDCGARSRPADRLCQRCQSTDRPLHGVNTSLR